MTSLSGVLQSCGGFTVTIIAVDEAGLRLARRGYPCSPSRLHAVFLVSLFWMLSDCFLLASTKTHAPGTLSKLWYLSWLIEIIFASPPQWFHLHSQHGFVNRQISYSGRDLPGGGQDHERLHSLRSSPSSTSRLWQRAPYYFRYHDDARPPRRQVTFTCCSQNHGIHTPVLLASEIAAIRVGSFTPLVISIHSTRYRSISG
jgi:hypothetical protein